MSGKGPGDKISKPKPGGQDVEQNKNPRVRTDLLKVNVSFKRHIGIQLVSYLCLVMNKFRFTNHK